MTPSICSLRQDDTHRLLPSRRSERSVLARLANDENGLRELIELEEATNEQLIAESNLLPGISVHELLFGVAPARLVNAAFTQAHPEGSAFNPPERGAWYAAFELETAEAEAAFQKSQELKEVSWRKPERFTFRDYLADFRADFHDIRAYARSADCLNPNRRDSSQKLAKALLASGSAGLIYPSAQRPDGTCLVCFRPALVTNVRRGHMVTLAFQKPGQAPLVMH